MLTRSWIALLLLTNYLLVVGMGCISRPEDQRELLLVQTSLEGQSYQECRYLRMDGLEAFMNEALATHYQNYPNDATPHHLISVVNGIDAHCPPTLVWHLFIPIFPAERAMGHYQPMRLTGVCRSIDAPPWLG